MPVLTSGGASKILIIPLISLLHRMDRQLITLDDDGGKERDDRAFPFLLSSARSIVSFFFTAIKCGP